MMIRKIKIAWIIFFLIILLQPIAYGKQTVTFGLIPGFHPITFVNDNGNPDGFVIELYSRIMQEFDCEPQFVIGNFKDLYKKLISNDLDFLGTLTRRPDRENLFFWPDEPTITGWGQLFVPHGKSINNIDELRGEKIGVVSDEAKGKSFISHMKSLGIPFSAIYFPNFDKLIDAVIQEMVIAGVANNKIVATNSKIDPTGVVFAPSSAYSTTGVSNVRMIPFVKRFNDRMAELKSDHNSYYWELYQKWFAPTRIQAKVIPIWTIWLIVVLTGGVAFFFVISKTLKNQVLARTEELRKSTQRLSIHIEQTPLGVIEWDLNFKVTQWNKAAQKIFGYSKKDAVGKTGTDLIIPNETHNLAKSIWNDLVKGEGGKRSTNKNITKDGKEIVCEWYNTTLLDENGIVIGVASLIQDISDRIQYEDKQRILEKQLQQAQKMEAMGTLAGGVAHDFNNILSAILGYAELVKEKFSPEDPSIKMQDQVLKAALRAKDLVKQILLFSRQSEQETIPIRPELVIKEALKLLRSSIPTTIEIKQNIPDGLGAILADATQIHQIIMNLCTNAYHAMREKGGTIGVSLSEKKILNDDSMYSELSLNPGSYLLLEVSDTGHGMDKATLEKVFNPYFTTKEKGEGTGLGLSVVHGIVRNYAGDIRIYSEPGLGTNVHIYFPKLKSDNWTLADQEKAILQTGDERILIVDDEPAILDMMRLSLEDLGYQVTAVEGSQEALNEFSYTHDNFDIVITDMTMPYMNGFELSKQIFKINPEIPIVLCSGYSELITKERAETIGIKALIMKPVLREVLSKIIREVLDAQE